MASSNAQTAGCPQGKASRPGGRLTAIENLAINMVYMAMQESRYNRSPDEYAAIAARLPHLKELHYRVNECLRGYLMGLKALGRGSPEFCRFEAGHKRGPFFERYPNSISPETLRHALIAHGFRVSRGTSG
jgi:hypothetical protein